MLDEFWKATFAMFVLVSSTIQGVSVDCNSIITLANSMNWKNGFPPDCCNSPSQTGLTCVSNRITQIDWSWKELEGSLNGQTLSSMTSLTKFILADNQIQTLSNSNYFPGSLIWLDLSYNKFELTPSLKFTNITYLNMYSNFLHDSLSFVNLPSKIQYLDLGWNNLDSISALPTSLLHLDLNFNILDSIPALGASLQYLDLEWNFIDSIQALPASLQYLDLSHNIVSGSIPSLPATLNYMDLSSNTITGGIPTLPSTLTSLFLNGNEMFGDVPDLPVTLRELILGTGGTGNHFTGVVKILNPTTLEIVSNYITDVVVTNSSKLTSCDLSNNPLLGNSNIIALTMCAKTGLYSANLLPITITTSKKTSKLVTSSARTSVNLFSSSARTSDILTKNITQLQSTQNGQQSTLTVQSSTRNLVSYAYTSSNAYIIAKLPSVSLDNLTTRTVSDPNNPAGIILN